jgi:hypothetical protein
MAEIPWEWRSTQERNAILTDPAKIRRDLEFQAKLERENEVQKQRDIALSDVINDRIVSNYEKTHMAQQAMQNKNALAQQTMQNYGNMVVQGMRNTGAMDQQRLQNQGATDQATIHNQGAMDRQRLQNENNMAVHGPYSSREELERWKHTTPQEQYHYEVHRDRMGNPIGNITYLRGRPIYYEDTVIDDIVRNTMSSKDDTPEAAYMKMLSLGNQFGQQGEGAISRARQYILENRKGDIKFIEGLQGIIRNGGFVGTDGKQVGPGLRPSPGASNGTASISPVGSGEPLQPRGSAGFYPDEASYPPRPVGNAPASAGPGMQLRNKLLRILLPPTSTGQGTNPSALAPPDETGSYYRPNSPIQYDPIAMDPIYKDYDWFVGQGINPKPGSQAVGSNNGPVGNAGFYPDEASYPPRPVTQKPVNRGYGNRVGSTPTTVPPVSTSSVGYPPNFDPGRNRIGQSRSTIPPDRSQYPPRMGY